MPDYARRTKPPAGPRQPATPGPAAAPASPTLQRFQRQADASPQARQLQRQARMTETPNRTGLPSRLKAGIEALSGIDMSDVRVHRNSDKPAQLSAHAYAQGTEIHLAPGQERHLPHEAWHVVQQKQGRVAPTMQLKADVPVNDDAALEREADRMGAAALQMHADAGAAPAHLALRSPVVQRQLVPGDPAPTIGAILGTRFRNVISGSGATPTYVALLQETTRSLGAYAHGVHMPPATLADCARFGVQQALAVGVASVQALPGLVSNAQMFASAHLIHLGLAADAADQIIGDRVKLALHDAMKTTVSDNINQLAGIADLRQVIQNNIGGLTVPPETPAQMFAIALQRSLQAPPLDGMHGYRQFKQAVMGTELEQVAQQYFSQLPGATRDKMRAVRAAFRHGEQRFAYWEATYLKKTHAGLADAQAALNQVNQPNLMDPADIDASYGRITGATGDQHLAQHPQNAAFGELAAPDKIFLSALLKQMPVVQAMLGRAGKDLNAAPVHPAWQNPVVMANQDNAMSSEEAKALQDPQHAMQRRLAEALRKINNLVDRRVLANTPTPNVILHKDLDLLKVLLKKKYDNLVGFRAFARESDNTVNVGLDERMDVLMHEMGHLIEDSLGTKEWLDIQSLLHMRHHNAPGPNQLSHVYDTGMARGIAVLIPSQARGEPAYKAEMPATGRYSAKFYGYGSTEVMSMTVERFGTPEKALDVIDKDPLQAAIILRDLQPRQFQEYVTAVRPAVTTWLP